MTVNYTTNLALAQPVTGTESGTWGDDVNNGLTAFLDVAIAGTQTIAATSGDVTLSLANGTSSATNLVQAGTGSTGSAQYLILNCTGTRSATWNLIVPSSSRHYIVINTTGYTVTVKGASTTGVTVPNNSRAIVAWNGSDFITITSTISNTATTFTALQTFNGTSSNLAAAAINIGETVTVSATAATGTINYDVTTQSVLYYTSNAAANWTVNFRASSGTSLNTVMATGQSITVAFLVTQGSTAYYNNAVTIDGTSVTPKYQGAVAWTAGYVSGVDVYTYTIIKTGSAAFTVFASQVRFG